jgi:hypothetical protein
MFYLVQQNANKANEITPIFSFDRTFAKLTFNCLLKVSREACCLLTGQSPMISPGSTFTFDTNLPEDHLNEIGGFPELIPEVNRDKPTDNLLNGFYSREDALFRCQILQDIGKKIILFIDRAYLLKGNQNGYANAWNFGEVLCPATNYFLNACVPGNAKILNGEETNDLDLILSDSKHLDQASPPPHELRDISSPSLRPITPVSSPIEETSSRFSDEFLKNFHAFYNENSDDMNNNGKGLVVNTDKPDSTIINKDELGRDQVNYPTQETSINFVRTQAIPEIKGNSKENLDTPLITHLLEPDRNEVDCRALIPHPIYGRNAQNSLVKYSPFYPELFSDN